MDKHKRASVDEILEETFPASDAPPTGGSEAIRREREQQRRREAEAEKQAAGDSGTHGKSGQGA
jgi:hypothetical protein